MQGTYEEQEVQKILDGLGIKYTTEAERTPSPSVPVLDFYLTDHDVYIEVKYGFSERSANQLKSQSNVILIQGCKLIEFLKKLLLNENNKTSYTGTY